MRKPPPLRELFPQSLKSEARIADEIVNIWLLRPLAACVVWICIPLGVTPNAVTVAAIIAGFAAAGVYLVGTPAAIAGAGLLVTLKDVLDDADGQLARATKRSSRRGRFIDSIGDAAVDVALFAAIGAVVSREGDPWAAWGMAVAGLVGITLRVSYHVFYQVSYLHSQRRYSVNRIVEEITDEDRAGDPVALKLQIVFSWIYTWQDRLMLRVDGWCRGGVRSGGAYAGDGERPGDAELSEWYGDKIGLRLSGLLGFGTELLLLTICSLAGNLRLYLLLNLLLMNGIWAASILYRRLLLSRLLLLSRRLQ